jgi:hypothetical protein
MARPLRRRTRGFHLAAWPLPRRTRDSPRRPASLPRRTGICDGVGDPAGQAERHLRWSRGYGSDVAPRAMDPGIHLAAWPLRPGGFGHRPPKTWVDSGIHPVRGLVRGGGFGDSHATSLLNTRIHIPGSIEGGDRVDGRGPAVGGVIVRLGISLIKGHVFTTIYGARVVRPSRRPSNCRTRWAGQTPRRRPSQSVRTTETASTDRSGRRRLASTGRVISARPSRSGLGWMSAWDQTAAGSSRARPFAGTATHVIALWYRHAKSVYKGCKRGTPYESRRRVRLDLTGSPSFPNVLFGPMRAGRPQVADCGASQHTPASSSGSPYPGTTVRLCWVALGNHN